MPRKNRTYSVKQFVEKLNHYRRRNDWYQFEGIVNGLPVRINGWGTWLQTFTVGDCNFPNHSQRKVWQFNKDLTAPFALGTVL